MAVVYTPRTPTAGVLYDVVRGHLAAFLATVAARTDGAGLPGFVTKEFRKFLGCGLITDLGGNLDVDPAFADLPHLAAGSPLIDAGSCAGTPPLDFEADARPSGLTCDVGADEVVP